MRGVHSRPKSHGIWWHLMDMIWSKHMSSCPLLTQGLGSGVGKCKASASEVCYGSSSIGSSAMCVCVGHLTTTKTHFGLQQGTVRSMIKCSDSEKGSIFAKQMCHINVSNCITMCSHLSLCCNNRCLLPNSEHTMFCHNVARTTHMCTLLCENTLNVYRCLMTTLTFHSSDAVSLAAVHQSVRETKVWPSNPWNWHTKSKIDSWYILYIIMCLILSSVCLARAQHEFRYWTDCSREAKQPNTQSEQDQLHIQLDELDGP